MTTATAKLPITCAGCGVVREVKPTKKDNARLPKGWKRRPDPDASASVVYCATCWKGLYRLRAVAFPVSEVLQGGTWQEFCAAVRRSLFRSRTLAQWAVNQLAATDVSRTLDMPEIPPHPPIGHEGKKKKNEDAEDKGPYMYGLAKAKFPDWNEWKNAYPAAGGVLRAAEKKYDALRKAIVWTAEKSVPTIRSQPYLVPVGTDRKNKNWKPSYVETESADGEQMTRVPAVNLPLDGKRWLLRLRGGQRRRRQLAAFAQLASGAAEACELAVYRKRSQDNRNRSGAGGRTANGGGTRVKYDIMVKMVAWLPRETREGKKVREGALTVHSSKNAFLVAVHPDFERPWMLNRNEVRRRIVTHARRLERIGEDTKAEARQMVNPRGPWKKLTPEERKQRRARKRARRHRLDYYDKICRLYRDYVDTFVKEGAAWLAAYADRRNVSKVVLDFSEKSYCPGFVWAALRDKIVANLEDIGIDVELIGAGTANIEEDNEQNGDGAGELSPSPDESA